MRPFRLFDDATPWAYHELLDLFGAFEDVVTATVLTGGPWRRESSEIGRRLALFDHVDEA